MAHEQVASEKQQMRCQGDQGHGFEKRFWVQEEREIKTRAPDLFKEEMTGLYTVSNRKVVTVKVVIVKVNK